MVLVWLAHHFEYLPGKKNLPADALGRYSYVRENVIPFVDLGHITPCAQR